jgi:hypothetical protein
METAAYFARKHGLERYLDDPAGLNEMILKLMVLQETIQVERDRRTPQGLPENGSLVVRRKAIGSFTARCSCDPAYRYAVETALKGSTATTALFQRGRFVALLRQMGLPERQIEGACANIVIDDDTHCFDPE